MKRYERSVFYAAVILGCAVFLPIVFFMLISLWPDRVLVSWLLFGLGMLFVFVWLALMVVRIGTVAKVRLDEEKLRSGRLYAHERLIEHGGPYRDEWSGQKQRAVMDEPYVQRPYEFEPPRQVAVPDEKQYIPYSGLKPLGIDSYDWDEKH